MNVMMKSLALVHGSSNSYYTTSSMEKLYSFLAFVALIVVLIVFARRK